MTGSLHEKNGKWQLVLYGEVGILFPDKNRKIPARRCANGLAVTFPQHLKTGFLLQKC